MKRIEITGWHTGANKVGADKLLAFEVGLGLAVGKAKMDEVLDGQTAEFELRDEQDAASIIAKLKALKFDARLKG